MEIVATKVCTKCGVDKPRDEYYSRGDGSVKIQAKCIQCLKKETAAGSAREYRKKNPDICRNIELKKNHGITLEQYNAVLAEQGGVCANCKRPPGSAGTGSNSKGTLAVDHCHVTGAFRGLLCTNCNVGIGHFFENPDLLESAARYIKEHRILVIKLLGEQVTINKIQQDLASSMLDDLEEA